MKKFFIAIFGGIILLAVLLFFCLVSLPDKLLHIFILNIGQGDAILIQTPALERILVDGGPDDKVLQELSDVMPFYERTIDVIILTHPHADHINGLIDVLKRYNVKQVIMTGVQYGYAGYKTFLDLLKQKHISVIFASGQGDFKLGATVLDMLYPLASFQGRSFQNLNNSSIVFRLLYGSEKFYFSGDLEIEGERKLIERGLDLSADALKAGHHGSRTSSSEALLDLIKPHYAFISCGAGNKFKHPHAETIKHFHTRGITTYRTDLDGRIELVSDGKKIVNIKTTPNI